MLLVVQSSRTLIILPNKKDLDWISQTSKEGKGAAFRPYQVVRHLYFNYPTFPLSKSTEERAKYNFKQCDATLYNFVINDFHRSKKKRVT